MCLFHKWKEFKIETIKNIAFGFLGAECPAIRIIEKCYVCNKERRIKLNLSMPDKYLKEKYDHLWKELFI